MVSAGGGGGGGGGVGDCTCVRRRGPTSFRATSISRAFRKRGAV